MCLNPGTGRNRTNANTKKKNTQNAALKSETNHLTPPKTLSSSFLLQAFVGVILCHNQGKEDGILILHLGHINGNKFKIDRLHILYIYDIYSVKL